ncbi:hypothetical protein [Marinoscillum furvescens]|uniref:Uncharacterized protein n=1 Tax=Marinoscillum furvescens DSM 4134 TaxID=1122208 RepID=A0A3D9L5W9_MARFU|nr:hypothetical protein [Marinoscillum furvescens]REE01086.1 hypothetical protein C7460_104106 [Marinoscillum furvescens DSM 4134]
MKYNATYKPDKLGRKPGIDREVFIAFIFLAFGLISGAVGATLICFFKWAL